VNVAVTAAFAVMVRQFDASSAAPDHDTNCQPAAATGVRHTLVPPAYALFVGAGFAVTDPPAGGDAATLRL